MTTDRFVTFKEIQPLFGIPWCRQHVWRQEKAKLFPKRRRFGNRRVVWSYDELRDFVDKVLDPDGHGED